MSILKKTRRKLYRAVNGSYFAYSFIMAIVVQVINVAFWVFLFHLISRFGPDDFQKPLKHRI